MKKSYVAIYQDKTDNSHVYYDFEKKEFFTVYEPANQPYIYSSGLVGLSLYTLFKNISVFTGYPPFVLLPNLLIGVVLGFALIYLIHYFANKNVRQKKRVIFPQNDQLYTYISTGSKQLGKLQFIIRAMLGVQLVCLGLLWVMPNDFVLLFVNLLVTPLNMIIYWACTPKKRKAVYDELKKELAV